MKYNIKALNILLFIPLFTFSQVQVRKTDPTSITNIMPFYSQGLLSNTQTVTFPFTRPPVDQDPGVPTNLNIDSSYDDLDDTTYEAKYIFDLGRVISTNLTLANGNWQSTAYGNVWCMKISIDNALNNSLHFGGLSLSPTANFYILNGDIGMVKGPYTSDALPTQGVFGTFPMNGQSCYLFLQENDPNNTSQDAITISGVVAGVQTVDGVQQTSSATAGQGGATTNGARVTNSCVPTVRCYEPWMTTARAVSMWSNGGGKACSGTLLNNDNNDGTSYFYSAHHCLPDNITDLRFASFRFQYWQTGCNTDVDMDYLEFFGGATLLHDVAFNDGDAILLRLANGPGIGDGPTYAGWSQTSNAPSQSQSVILHHPEAGDMRITNTRRVRTFWWDADFWKASYHFGVMMYGSSGSALFNENHQVVGTLSRGASSCFFFYLGDRFGKFNRGWGGMQQYLSPIQNNDNIPELPLYPLNIAGSTSLGCTTGAQYYSGIPNKKWTNFERGLCRLFKVVVD